MRGSLAALGMKSVTDTAARWVGHVCVGVTVALALVPALFVAVLSFSNDDRLAFPPREWGLRQYETLLGEGEWGHAVGYSLEVGVPVAILCVLISIPALFGAFRSSLPGRHQLIVAGVAGMIVPVTAYAVALYGIYVKSNLLGTHIGLVLAHVVIAIPMVLLIGQAGMAQIPIELELAAMTAGAPRWRAWFEITLRVLLPSLLAGGILAFVTSFDEAALVNFIAGPGQTTLPKAILNSARLGIDPVITAVATLMTLATSVVVIAATYLRRMTP